MARSTLIAALLLAAPWTAFAQGPEGERPREAELAAALRNLSPRVLRGDRAEAARAMLRDHLRRRIAEANQASSRQWREIETRQQWEAFRDVRLEALRASLGDWPAPPAELPVRISGKLQGDGYRIDKVAYQSRPGLWVTANLYRPTAARDAMPGILLSHSHHSPKWQGELQDMGATWARRGCLVLVVDHLGHGERRQHPFKTGDDFAGDFRPGRQDYYFRYDTGIQLHLVGESLMGWMAWDLMRGVDLLLAQPGIDREKIVLLGAVAGGGDPAAVAGALDPRISAVAPFNFGGPQPETGYPLPDDAEETFNYAGGGSWESTRNLGRSAADGFLPWVIVGGIAPRGLVYGHEFAWDGERDPVWRRLERIYGFYDAGDRLAVAHGAGLLRGQPPEATHCTHIGRVHRQMIHPPLKRWFQIDVDSSDEYSRRRTAEELTCFTPELSEQIQAKRLVEMLPDLAASRIAAGANLESDKPSGRRAQVRSQWSGLLGPIESAAAPRVLSSRKDEAVLSGSVRVERVELEVEEGIVVPLLLLQPTGVEPGKTRLVVAVSQGGKQIFLKERSAELAAVLAGGAAVCLPDVRGTGETSEDDSRGPFGTATARSSTELMLGGTMVGARLRDLRSVLAWLRARPEPPAAYALWGDSFAPANPTDIDLKRPHRAGADPAQSEPLGGLLALLAPLYEDDVQAIYVRGGLSDFGSVLNHWRVLVPHDCVIPGAATTGDLPELAAALGPVHIRLEKLVDGQNRALSDDAMLGIMQTVARFGRIVGAPELSISAEATGPAAWLGVE